MNEQYIIWQSHTYYGMDGKEFSKDQILLYEIKRIVKKKKHSFQKIKSIKRLLKID